LAASRRVDRKRVKDAENGSTRSSFNTTIDVLEGLLEHERGTGKSADVAEARHRGETYVLERRMMRRLSTGEVIDSSWSLFSFPTRYHYDVLRGLDYLRSAGVEPDERCAPRQFSLLSTSAVLTVDGGWRIRIRERCTSTWTKGRANRVAGSPSAPCACSTGTRKGKLRR